MLSRTFFIFVATYFGIALGKVPGLVIDRVGIALLGAIAMVALDGLAVEEAVRAIDAPTILLLYSLMVVSAQLRLGGFYTWAAKAMVPLLGRPRLFLLISMLVSAVLSALLANDIVCFAFTPVLAVSVLQAGLNPVPFLIGLAVSSNIGSAATIMGNPQNMLIGQVGRLDFADFLWWCAPPSLAALMAGYAVVLWIYRNRFVSPPAFRPAVPTEAWPTFNPWQSAKGLAAVTALVMLFFTSIPRELSAIGIAGMLLCSRKMKTREMLALVDWHLITLFCALFIVIHGIGRGPLLSQVMDTLVRSGFDPRDPVALAGLSTLLSNIFSNVPAVMLLLGFLDPQNPVQWYTLAVSSTFAGNLIVLGSIANLIVIEQAARLGVAISFRAHASVGIPVTGASLAILAAWIWMSG